MDNSTDEDSFIVYRSIDSMIFNKIGEANADITSYEDKSLSQGTEYWYYITAKNSIGESESSSIINVTTLVSNKSVTFNDNYIYKKYIYLHGFNLKNNIICMNYNEFEY